MSTEVEIAQEFLQVLLQTERASEEQFEAYQAELLNRLVGHAYAHVPFYGSYPRVNGEFTATSEVWQKLPFMSRRDLVERDSDLRARDFPKSHGLITTAHTGGSTGPSARRDMSSLEGLARFVASYRMFKTWGLDQSLPLFWLRKQRPGPAPRYDRWGYPWLQLDQLGMRHAVDIALPAGEQLSAVQSEAPAYVNTLPSNINRLCHEAKRLGIDINIPHIISVAEYLPPEIRKAAAKSFHSRIIDVFSSAEGGVMAIECPESGLYHIQSELILFEIIRENGQPCETGEVGEVVVTPLYGYATPLLRYRSGDFVERGPRCTCGRSLPTISRIVGRREHMFEFDDGTSRLPPIDRVSMTDLVGHDAWVLVQTGSRHAELRIAGSLDDGQRIAALDLAHGALPQPFDVKIQPVEALPLTSGSKRHFTLNALPRPS
jgi:phenylacetate-CoA ligase